MLTAWSSFCLEDEKMLKVIIIGFLVLIFLFAILLLYACVVDGSKADRQMQE